MKTILVTSDTGAFVETIKEIKRNVFIYFIFLDPTIITNYDQLFMFFEQLCPDYIFHTPTQNDENVFLVSKILGIKLELMETVTESFILSLI
jgi:hypothetical protein